MKLLQHGSLRVVRLHCSKRQGEEAVAVLRPGTRNWLGAISAICLWSQQSQSYPDLKEGYIEPHLSVGGMSNNINPLQLERGVGDGLGIPKKIEAYGI